MRPTLSLLFVLAALGPSSPPAATASETGEAPSGVRVYMSWKAPHGQPRATESLMASCAGDSTAKDTLWLTFEADTSAHKFYGWGLTMFFHTTGADTLGPFWWFGGGEANPYTLRIEFPDSSWAAQTPWNAPGFGAPSYDRTTRGGRLRMIYAVPSDLAGPIEGGKPYALARLIFPRPRAQLANCSQAICIEWSESDFSFDLDRKPAGQVPGGRRFATWNSPKGSACTERAAGRAPKPWKPPGTH